MFRISDAQVVSEISVGAVNQHDEKMINNPA